MFSAACADLSSHDKDLEEGDLLTMVFRQEIELELSCFCCNLAYLLSQEIRVLWHKLA